ncbi:MAG: hypothetical protein ACFB4I_02885 [Cyanophyceae cyanobacterium]
MATETRWEGAVLDKLTSNGERIAVIEKDVSELKTTVNRLVEDVSEIKSLLGWLKWIGGAVITIALALVANAISTYVLHF